MLTPTVNSSAVGEVTDRRTTGAFWVHLDRPMIRNQMASSQKVVPSYFLSCGRQGRCPCFAPSRISEGGGDLWLSYDFFTHSRVKTQSWGDYRSSSLEIPHPSPLLRLQHRGIRCLCALQSLAPPPPNSLPQSLLGNTPKAEQIVYLPPLNNLLCLPSPPPQSGTQGQSSTQQTLESH